jgi:tRNA(Ile)-lysidine synthase TilS/MesJ
MSGGVDSTTLAAVAADLGRRLGGCQVDAVTFDLRAAYP